MRQRRRTPATTASATTAASSAEASASTFVLPSLTASLARAPVSLASFRRAAARARAGTPTRGTRLSTTAAKAVLAILRPRGVGTSVVVVVVVFTRVFFFVIGGGKGRGVRVPKRVLLACPAAARFWAGQANEEEEEVSRRRRGGGATRVAVVAMKP